MCLMTTRHPRTSDVLIEQCKPGNYEIHCAEKCVIWYALSFLKVYRNCHGQYRALSSAGRIAGLHSQNRVAKVLNDRQDFINFCRTDLAVQPRYVLLPALEGVNDTNWSNIVRQTALPINWGQWLDPRSHGYVRVQSSRALMTTIQNPIPFCYFEVWKQKFKWRVCTVWESFGCKTPVSLGTPSQNK